MRPFLGVSLPCLFAQPAFPFSTPPSTSIRTPSHPALDYPNPPHLMSAPPHGTTPYPTLFSPTLPSLICPSPIFPSLPFPASLLRRFNKVWPNWLDGIHDWCISRQLWWGHQIPVWYAPGHDGYFVARCVPFTVCVPYTSDRIHHIRFIHPTVYRLPVFYRLPENRVCFTRDGFACGTPRGTRLSRLPVCCGAFRLPCVHRVPCYLVCAVFDKPYSSYVLHHHDR